MLLKFHELRPCVEHAVIRPYVVQVPVPPLQWDGPWASSAGNDATRCVHGDAIVINDVEADQKWEVRRENVEFEVQELVSDRGADVNDASAPLGQLRIRTQ